MSPVLVSLSLPAPLPAQRFSVASPSSTPLASLLPAHLTSSCYLRTRSVLPSPTAVLSDVLAAGQTEVDLEVVGRLLGGKGGFGAQLRATGGRMSSQKASNNDSCRDLTGRRLSSIKQAKKMSDILEAEKDYKKLKSKAAKDKLEALERSLGISVQQAEAALEGMDDEPEEAAAAAEGSGSGSTSPAAEGAAAKKAGPPKAKDLTKEDLARLAGRKHKFDDSEYLEQSREINEGVRGAVAAGLLKKRKKAKLAAGASATPAAPVAV